MKAFFNHFHPVEAQVLDEYLSHWTAFKLKKKTIMTSKGETERYMYFVLEGIQKSYYLHRDRQHIIAFTYAPSLTGIPDSFLSQQPSRYNLETITDSCFLRIPYEKHAELMKKYHPIETLFRKLTEHLLVGTLQRHYELMALDINERFTTFAKRSPHLFQRVSHKDLAAYLNINATNFSKLYNKTKI